MLIYNINNNEGRILSVLYMSNRYRVDNQISTDFLPGMSEPQQKYD